MTDEPFAVRWARKERELGLGDDPIGVVSRGELALPREAAPCLSFDRFDRPRPIWEVYGIPEHWTAADRDRLAPYRMIGSDGAGNPVCVDGGGAVWLLDHENHFRTTQFVNSSVLQLGECLLARFGEADADRFRTAVWAADQPALTEGAFWWCEASAFGGGDG